ncbi:MAG: hypothetical protein ACOCQD_03300 [archaeon]
MAKHKWPHEIKAKQRFYINPTVKNMMDDIADHYGLNRSELIRHLIMQEHKSISQRTKDTDRR